MRTLDGLLAHEAALERLVALTHPTDVERVPIDAAAGRVLADATVIASVDVPPFANSAMDGFAVRAADLPASLRIVGEVAAGASELPRVAPGTAVRIMTGAPIPPGADAVAPVERCEVREAALEVDGPVAAGDHVRAAGHDTRAGDSFRVPGTLTPARVAVLASVGLGEIEVRRRPRVAVLSTGDELVEPGGRLGPGQIHDANGVALAAAVTEAGGEARVLPRRRDDLATIEAALRSASAEADLIVTSGGVSVGEHDHVRHVLESRGTLDFWRVAVQPGKPLAVGHIDGTPLIGLPGNPVSALVTFELFVRPFLRAMLGLHGDGRLRVRALLDEPMGKDPARRAFLRVSLRRHDGQLRARSAGGQLSSQLRPMAEADGLLIVPEDAARAEPGGEYDVIVLGSEWSENGP